MIVSIAIILSAILYSYSIINRGETNSDHLIHSAYAAKFAELSKNGNSSCSGGFKDYIADMPDNGRLQGSCCSPMSFHRYYEQVEGLKAFFLNDPSRAYQEIRDLS